jgi:hypothetical protein
VSAAASFIATALLLLQYASDGLAIGMRRTLELELRRLGPDHKVTPFSGEQLHAFITSQYGEDAAADIVAGHEPDDMPQQLSVEARADQLEQQLRAARKENETLKAQVAKKPAAPGPRGGKELLASQPKPDAPVEVSGEKADDPPLAPVQDLNLTES